MTRVLLTVFAAAGANPWNKLGKEEPSRDHHQISLQPGISEIPVGFMLDSKEIKKRELILLATWCQK